MEELEKRKEQFLEKAKGLKEKKKLIVFAILAAIVWFGYYIRTLNLPLLGGKYLPDVDSYAFLRYTEYIVEHGFMPTFDPLRYYPFGYNPAPEFGLLSHLVEYLYHIMNFFNPAVKAIDAAILYPPVIFAIGLVFFFLFVRKLFDFRIALLSSFTLAVMPSYLYRTMAGVFDKEPFGMALMFASFAGYCYALREDKFKNYIAYAVLAGFATALLGVAWGGVQFFYIAVGVMLIITALFGASKTKDLHIASAWFLTSQAIILILRPDRTGITNFFASYALLPIVLGIVMILMHYLIYERNLFSIKSKLEKYAPGLVVLVSSLAVLLVLSSIIVGPSALLNAARSILNTMLHPSAETRWAMTVAENHQPYIIDWFGQFGKLVVYSFLLGAVALFYTLTKRLKKNGLYLTGFFAAALAAFILTRYSSDSIFNGNSSLSTFLYVASMIVFFGVSYYLYYKYHKLEYVKDFIHNLDKPLLLLIFFLLLTLAAGRSLIRLVFVLSPAAAISMSYLVLFIYDEAKLRLKKDIYKISIYVLLSWLLFIPVWGGGVLVSYAQSSMGQARGTGLSYDVQWQHGMDWVRANTPVDAVFAHWWDYGYWVQWGGQRATISDGGNAVPEVNYFTGRYVLTGQTDIEALEFLKARNVSYLLIISDEIGKYPAFSSIGSDVNYDRYAWVPTMNMDPSKTQETRNETVYVYVGGTPLDEDFMFNNKVYPGGSAGIAGFSLPVRNVEVQDGNGTKQVQTLGQPEAFMVNNGVMEKMPIECLYVEGKEILYNDKPGFPACVRLIPTYNGNQVNPIGSAIYISPRVRRTLFYRYYIAGQESEHIKLAYSDENAGMPFAVVNGRLIGPLKIWKLNYDDSIQIKPEYLKQELPDPNVTMVRR